MRTLRIDGDQLLYRAAGYKRGYVQQLDLSTYKLHVEGFEELDLDKMQPIRYCLPDFEMSNMVDSMIKSIVRQTVNQCKLQGKQLRVAIYLGRGNNIKSKLQIDPRYKSNRVYQKPPGISKMIDYILTRYEDYQTRDFGCDMIYYDVCICEDAEADEYLIKHAEEKDIIASPDKDVLYGSPGYKYDTKHNRFLIVDYKTAVKYTFALALSGDAADGIKGLYRVGEPKFDPETNDFVQSGSWKLLTDYEKKLKIDNNNFEQSYYKIALEVLKYRLPGMHPLEREMLLVKNLKLIELIPILDKVK